MPSGPPFNGQQPPPQAAFHQMYGNLPQPGTPGTQYADGQYAMGGPIHQGHHPHQLPQTHQSPQYQPQQSQHFHQGYYAANMSAVNGNMHASSQMTPFHDMYASPMPRPQQPQLQPHHQHQQFQTPNTMQFDGQAQSHLVGHHHVPPTYHSHQTLQQPQQFQQAQQLPQPIHYSPSPIPQPSPSPAVPTPHTNRPSPAPSTIHVASPHIATSPRPPMQPHVPTLQSRANPQAGGSPAIQSAPYPSPYIEPQSRPQPSPKPGGVNISPALSARSSTISKKSPSVSSRPMLADQNSVLVCVAEECFDKARGNLQDVVSSSSGVAVVEYQKLIATGLSCLETVLLSNRLTPRQEAKVRLRYASILYEDTESLMEAETALSKGVKLCDKVC